MPLIEPTIKRAVSFVDGQNLFNSVKECFGYPFPNYNISALSAEICNQMTFQHSGSRFYTGIPDAPDRRNSFWQNKLRAMSRQGVYTFTRPTRNDKEKGIDVRIALDVIGMAHRREYDVAIIFSQDQDLSEVVPEVISIAQEQNRWIKVVCAYPCASHINKRGINKTQWFQIERDLYERCIDLTDYRPKPPSPIANVAG